MFIKGCEYYLGYICTHNLQSCFQAYQLRHVLKLIFLSAVRQESLWKPSNLIERNVYTNARREALQQTHEV